MKSKLPIEIQNIIIDYKYQIENEEKRKMLNKEFKIIIKNTIENMQEYINYYLIYENIKISKRMLEERYLDFIFSNIKEINE